MQIRVIRKGEFLYLELESWHQNIQTRLNVPIDPTTSQYLIETLSQAKLDIESELEDAARKRKVQEDHLQEHSD